MSKEHSYRQILRSSSIIGGASVINILVGLVRTKIAAILLGPAGIGMIGLLQNLMATASTLSELGFGTAGTRQIAEATGIGDMAAITAARRALFWGTLGLAMSGAVAFWLARDVLATKVLGDPNRSAQIGWLAIGVALSVAAASQPAQLNGLRRIGDLARFTVASGVLSTLLGVGALLWLQEAGVLLFVLAVPVSSFVVGHCIVSRLGPIRAPATPVAEFRRQWHAMARFGFAFMISGVIVTLGQLMVRTLVQRELGAAALGQFQAASTIGMAYIGFVLGAMGADYYPRLAAAIHDHRAANQLVNEQTEVALLLAGPAFLTMLGLAPWVIDILYSHAFNQTVTILRWQILGDVLKVASWPLAFVILAAGDGKTFMLCEALGIGVLMFFTWLWLPWIGTEATGIAYFVMYMAYLPLVHLLGQRRTAFRWSPRVVALLVLIIGATVCVFAVAKLSQTAGAVTAVLLAFTLSIYSFAQIGVRSNIGGRIGALARSTRGLLLKTRVFRE